MMGLWGGFFFLKISYLMEKKKDTETRRLAAYKK